MPKAVVFTMPLTEKRIAELILLYIFCQITPEQLQELMEGYVNLSAANRLHFEKITNKDYLRARMLDLYMQEGEEPPPGEE